MDRAIEHAVTRDPVATDTHTPERNTDRDGMVAIPGIVPGSVVSTDDDGEPLVRWGLGLDDPIRASVPWMDPQPDWRRCGETRVLLGFEGGSPKHPVILALLDPPRATKAPARVRMEGTEELVLECGAAKISLRADGRIHILGGEVVSRARRTHKIKGGSVHIN